jgi:Bacterial TniB protein
MTPNLLSDGEIARLISEYEEIRHPHKQLTAIHRAINLARAEVRQSRADAIERKQRHPGVTIKQAPLPLISVFGPSGTAKSHIIKTYYEEFCVKENWAMGKRPVFDFELSVDANKRQLQVDALTALGDPDPEKGNESALRRRVSKITANQETELGMADEVQHVVASDTGKSTKSVGDAVKKILNTGMFGMAIFGTDKAGRIFDSGEEVAQRCDWRFELAGLDSGSSDDRTLFVEFLRTFRTGIERRGVLRNAKTLESTETIGNLFLQSDGRIGLSQRIMKSSLRVALERGASSLLPGHFAIAITRGKKLFGLKENVFEDYADKLEAEYGDAI